MSLHLFFLTCSLCSRAALCHLICSAFLVSYLFTLFFCSFLMSCFFSFVQRSSCLICSFRVLLVPLLLFSNALFSPFVLRFSYLICSFCVLLLFFSSVLSPYIYPHCSLYHLFSLSLYPFLRFLSLLCSSRLFFI